MIWFLKFKSNFSVFAVYEFCLLLLSLSLYLDFIGHFSGESGLAGFIGAKDNRSGDDNWSYKMCKAPVKLSPPTNQHPMSYRLNALPVAQPTVLKH